MISGKIAAKSFSTNPDYTLLTGEGWATVRQEASQTNFEIGDFIQADSESASEITRSSDAKIKSGVEGFLERNSLPKKAPLLVNDEAMRKLEPTIGKMVSLAARALLELTPALVRFNDDCDGISAGILVKNALAEFVREKKIPLPKGFLKGKQCNSAVYESGEAAYDCQDFASERFGRKPLLFLLDFGANEESVEGLELASGNFDILVIDHHVYSPKAKGIARAFVNPLETGGSSSHTTGLLAFEFARRLSTGDEEYAHYSMQSDKSAFWDKRERKQALVLDFLARQGMTLERYEKALRDETEFHYLEASSKINAAIAKALPTAKEEDVGGAVLANINLEGVVRKNEFPPKGKVLNGIQEHFEKQNPLAASVGFDSSTIQFRVSKPLHARGFKATRVIGLVKKEYPWLSGGGHEQAAAMRFDSEHAKAILEKTLDYCRKEILSALEK